MLNGFNVLLTTTTTAAPADIGTFTDFGTDLLDWLITTMQTVLNFLIQNPIALVSIVFGLIIAAVGMIFNILRGH